MRLNFVLTEILFVFLAIVAFIATITLPIAQLAIVIFAWILVLAVGVLLIYISLH